MLAYKRARATALVGVASFVYCGFFFRQFESRLQEGALVFAITLCAVAVAAALIFTPSKRLTWVMFGIVTTAIASAVSYAASLVVISLQHSSFDVNLSWEEWVALATIAPYVAFKMWILSIAIITIGLILEKRDRPGASGTALEGDLPQ